MVLTAVLTGLLAPGDLSARAMQAQTRTSGGVGPYGPYAPFLFQSEAPLEIRIESDFGQLRRDREEENPEREGTVFVREADGSETEWPTLVRTRGNFRLQSRICDVPPLRLNFPRSQVIGGVFEGQDKIKLVTHCRDRYVENELREYLAYRIFNLITDESFRVRLANVTYIDTSGRHEPLTRIAFFVEMEETLAARLRGDVIPDEDLTEGIHPARILAPNAARVDLFAYMLGNTDYTMYFPSVNGGLHNIVPIELENGTVVAVPYDFDLSGLVDVAYAEPSEAVDIDRVTERIFRGLCRPGFDFGAAYAEYTTMKPAITSLVQSMDLLPADEREDVLDYLDGFWNTIEDEGRARQRIERACRPT